MTTKFKGPRKKKGEKPEAMPPCPRADIINVIQFQLFDNGPKPGRGVSRHTVKLELYCEAKFVIAKPYWTRSVAMLDPKVFFSWVDAQSFDDDVMALYEDTRRFSERKLADDETEWLKFGHVEDTRLRTRYPGQFVVVRKRKSGPVECWLQHGADAFDAEAMIYNKFWKPGSRVRLFYGFYDPHGEYERAKAIAAKEAAVRAPVATEEAVADDLLSMLEAGMREAGI